MVKTLPVYEPAAILNESISSAIRFAFRVLTREGETVINFGEFKDLLSYSDSMSVESPAGSWTVRMRVLLSNQELLKKLHPGMLVEAYCARNDDPLLVLPANKDDKPNRVDQITAKRSPSPAVFQKGGESDNFALLTADFADGGKPKPPPQPEERDYLDLAPYLLMRGIISGWGRSSTVSSSGAETSLYLSGESYGKVYRDSSVLLDKYSPTTWGKSLEVKWQTQSVNWVAPLYYGVLRHWVEEFWGESTGWEARTRTIPTLPHIYARLNSEGSCWEQLRYLSVQGIFHLFVDHTGALCWEKLPYSGKDDALLDKPMSAYSNSPPLRNWEDLPSYELKSWRISNWSDRLSEDAISNFVACRVTAMGMGNDGGRMDSGQIYNMGSIRQYGGPRKMEIAIPYGTGPQFPYGDAGREDEEKRLRTFMDLVCLETIRWYDRPLHRVMVSCQGEAAWRINTRIQLKEDWHFKEAKPGEYYVVSRSHEINFASASWTTQMAMIRDRRTRYLGIGVEPEKPAEESEDEPQDKTELDVPIAPDEYWLWDRSKGGKIVNIGNSTLPMGKEIVG